MPNRNTDERRVVLGRGEYTDDGTPAVVSIMLTRSGNLRINQHSGSITGRLALARAIEEDCSIILRQLREGFEAERAID